MHYVKSGQPCLGCTTEFLRFQLALALNEKASLICNFYKMHGLQFYPNSVNSQEPMMCLKIMKAVG